MSRELKWAAKFQSLSLFWMAINPDSKFKDDITKMAKHLKFEVMELTKNLRNCPSVLHYAKDLSSSPAVPIEGPMPTEITDYFDNVTKQVLDIIGKPKINMTVIIDHTETQSRQRLARQIYQGKHQI